MLWELPQNVLGALTFVSERARGRVVHVEREDGRFVVETEGTAISLGHVVFWSRRSSRWHDLDAVQSKMLGPLYLPIVGVPSTARAIYAFAYREVTGRKWTRYYDGFPERWADRLGGVDR